MLTTISSEMIEAHRGLMIRIARGYGFDASELDDILHVATQRALGRECKEKLEKAYLATAVRNECINRKKSSATNTRALQGLAQQQTRRDPDAWEIAYYNELLERLLGPASGLTDGEKNLLLLLLAPISDMEIARKLRVRREKFRCMKSRLKKRIVLLLQSAMD